MSTTALVIVSVCDGLWVGFCLGNIFQLTVVKHWVSEEKIEGSE